MSDLMSGLHDGVPRGLHDVGVLHYVERVLHDVERVLHDGVLHDVEVLQARFGGP